MLTQDYYQWLIKDGWPEKEGKERLQRHMTKFQFHLPIRTSGQPKFTTESREVTLQVWCQQMQSPGCSYYSSHSYVTPLAFQKIAQGLTPTHTKRSFQLKTRKTIRFISPIWLLSFCLCFSLHHLIVLFLDCLSECYFILASEWPL